MEVLVADPGLRGEGLPVPGAGLVEADDEVVDVFGFGGDLAEGNTVA